MEEEHCVKKCCDNEFVSNNYGVKTTPVKEYTIATGKLACPQDAMNDKQGRKVRTVQSIEVLNDLPLVKKAGLEKEEIVAVV
jgi:hypothetical protein